MTDVCTQHLISLELTSLSEGDLSLHLNGVHPHVAAHTAAAFNRAMQAVPDGDGWTYTTKSGVWHITTPMMQSFYHAQHEDVTGDNDPSWLTTDARSLIGCLDAIDEVEADNACTECHRLLGDDATTQISRDVWLCDDCMAEEAKHQAGMAEMAADDMAHAARDKEMGL